MRPGPGTVMGGSSWADGNSVSHVRLHGPMGCRPPGLSAHGILQPRILEWVAISFPPGVEPRSPALQMEDPRKERLGSVGISGAQGERVGGGSPDTSVDAAAPLPATFEFGLSPCLGLQHSQPCCGPSVTGTRLYSHDRPSLSPRSLMPLLDPDSGLLVLAGKVRRTHPRRARPGLNWQSRECRMLAAPIQRRGAGTVLPRLQPLPGAVGTQSESQPRV